jgi:hypothetical protein
MQTHVCNKEALMSPGTPVQPISLTFLARNTRLQMAQTRLTLIACSKRARLTLGIGALVFGVHCSIALGILSPMLHRHGLAAVLRVYWPELAVLATMAAAGLGLIAALLLRADHPLTRAELVGGALLQLGPDGLAATVRGATVYCEWEHVAVEHSPDGLIFVLARSVVHLLPHEAISDAEWGLVRALLAAVGKGPRPSAGAAGCDASFSNPETISAYSIE